MHHIVFGTFVIAFLMMQFVFCILVLSLDILSQILLSYLEHLELLSIHSSPGLGPLSASVSSI